MSRTQCQCTLFLLLELSLSSSWLKTIIFAKDPYHPDEYEYVCIYGLYEYKLRVSALLTTLPLCKFLKVGPSLIMASPFVRQLLNVAHSGG